MSTSVLTWEASQTSTSASPADTNQTSSFYARIKEELKALEHEELCIRNEYISHDNDNVQCNWKSHLVVNDSKVIVDNVLGYIKSSQHKASCDRTSSVCHTKLDLFKGFDWSNILLAGGSVYRALNSYKHNNDFDLYIYGLNHKQALDKLAKIVLHFTNQSDNGLRDGTAGPTSHMVIVRSKTAITFSWTACVCSVQVCLTLARDPLELLSSFDIAPCKMAFDGKCVYMTKTAEFALKHKLFALSATTNVVASDLLASRVSKYCHIGKCHVLCLDNKYKQLCHDINEGNIVYDKKQNSWYSIIDDDEIQTSYNALPKTDVKNAREIAMSAQYRNKPQFIVMRYKPNPGTLNLGVRWDIYNKVTLWQLLNDTNLWYEFISNPKYETSPWLNIPQPVDLSRDITFLSLTTLLNLLESRRTASEQTASEQTA